MLLFSVYLTYQRYGPKNLEFKNYKNTQITKPEKILPTRISIPSQKINNLVFSASITNNYWETTDGGISYLSSTPIPGNTGNSVFYGHNWPSILGNLTKIRPGNEIKVYLNNGEVKTFVVKYTSVVNPEDSDILSASTDERITIYTCTGFLDSKRFVAVALLKK